MFIFNSSKMLFFREMFQLCSIFRSIILTSFSQMRTFKKLLQIRCNDETFFQCVFFSFLFRVFVTIAIMNRFDKISIIMRSFEIYQQSTLHQCEIDFIVSFYLFSSSNLCCTYNIKSACCNINRSKWSFASIFSRIATICSKSSIAFFICSFARYVFASSCCDVNRWEWSFARYFYLHKKHFESHMIVSSTRSSTRKHRSTIIHKSNLLLLFNVVLFWKNRKTWEKYSFHITRLL